MRRYNLTIGEKLRNLRILQNKTQKEVAGELCISRATLSNYETGVRLPDISTLTLLADYYGVDANYFIDTTKIRAVLSENDNHTLFLMQEKEKEKPKRKMSPSSLIALNYFNLGGKTLKRDKKDERK